MFCRPAARASRCRPSCAAQRAPGEVAPARRRSRTAGRRVRLRAVASAAVRPVPRRERPAAAPAVQGAGDARRLRRARRTSSGEPDGWSVAARFAAEILPGIFRLDDPCVRLRLAPEGRYALEQILDGLPVEVFAADDALGWVYQFWQKDKKDEVNASERKIGGADLGPVTQLFTENYMVRFLLENSLGAWWAARHPDSPLVKGFDYLRFDDDGGPRRARSTAGPTGSPRSRSWTRAAGPATSSLRRSRCCGRCAPRRKASRRSTRRTRCSATISSAWSSTPAASRSPCSRWRCRRGRPAAGGGNCRCRNIACSGIPVKAPVDEWKALAGGDERLENALVRLHILFRDADTLGSLIDPKRTAETRGCDGLTADRSSDVEWDDVAPLLASARRPRALTRRRPSSAPTLPVSPAPPTILSRKYTLVATNVPYLTGEAQSELLQDYLRRTATRMRQADLATAFARAHASLSDPDGS